MSIYTTYPASCMIIVLYHVMEKSNVTRNGYEQSPVAKLLASYELGLGLTTWEESLCSDISVELSSCRYIYIYMMGYT